MSAINDDRWLERALQSAEPHLDDDGFTLRVMAALPPARAVRPGRPEWIVIGGAAVGSAVVASQFPLQPFLDLALHTAQIPWIGAVVMLACMAVALLAEPARKLL